MKERSRVEQFEVSDVMVGAARLATRSGQPFINSFEPAKDWFWKFRTDDFYDGQALAEP